MALKPDSPWITAVFPVIHVAFGVPLTYPSGHYLNRTVLEVNEGRLTVRHGPLPGPETATWT